MLPATAIIPDALARTAPILDVGLAGLVALALVLALLGGLVLGAAGRRRAPRPGRRALNPLPVAPRAAA